MTRHKKGHQMAKGKKLNPEQKKEVKTIIAGQIENKVIGTTVHATGAINGAGVIVWLSDALQGLTDNNRIGDLIKMNFLEFNYLVQQKDVPGNNANLLNHRVIIFSDRFANGALPNVVDILQTDNPFSTYDTRFMYDRPKRFHVYYDKLWVTATPAKFSSANPVAQQPCGHIVQKKRVNLHNLPAKYTGQAGTAADIGANQLFLLYTNDGTTAVSDFFMDFALSYKDA